MLDFLARAAPKLALRAQAVGPRRGAKKSSIPKLGVPEVAGAARRDELALRPRLA